MARHRAQGVEKHSSTERLDVHIIIKLSQVSLSYKRKKRADIPPFLSLTLTRSVRYCRSGAPAKTASPQIRCFHGVHALSLSLSLCVCVCVCVWCACVRRVCGVCVCVDGHSGGHKTCLSVGGVRDIGSGRQALKSFVHSWPATAPRPYQLSWEQSEPSNCHPSHQPHTQTHTHTRAHQHGHMSAYLYTPTQQPAREGGREVAHRRVKMQ